MFLGPMLVGLLAVPGFAAEKSKGLTRRGFLASSAMAAVSATRSSHAGKLLASTAGTTAAPVAVAEASATEAWFTKREDQLAAERMRETFAPKPHAHYFVESTDWPGPNPLHLQQSASLPEVRLRPGISTEHFTTTLARLERDLAETFAVDPRHVKMRGEILRGVSARHNINLAGNDLPFSAPVRAIPLDESFDQAYLEGLKRVDEDYAAQAQNLWHALKKDAHRAISDRREWRRQCWFNHLTSVKFTQQFSLERSDFEEFQIPPLARLQHAADGLATVRERARAEIVALEQIAAGAEAIEEDLARKHNLDIEAVYEATDFQLSGGDLPWREDYREREFPRPPQTFIAEFMERLSHILPNYARQLARALAALETEVRIRYQVRSSISPEALSELEDELMTRFPLEYARAREGIQWPKPEESSLGAGKPRADDLTKVLEDLFRHKQILSVDPLRPMRDQIAKARNGEEARLAKLNALRREGEIQRASHDVSAKKSNATQSTAPLEFLRQVHSPVQALDDLEMLGPKSAPSCAESVAAGTAPNVDKSLAAPVSEFAALPAPLPDPVSSELERVQSQERVRRDAAPAEGDQRP